MFKINCTILLLIGLILLILLYFCGSLLIMRNNANKVENAHAHAKALDLKNYKVKCDDSSCSCTIVWETNIGQELKTFNCCGRGCE